MRTLEVTLPDKIANELDDLVENGWFTNEAEIMRVALLEYIRHNRFTLTEQFQREDIAWALTQKKTRA